MLRLRWWRRWTMPRGRRDAGDRGPRRASGLVIVARARDGEHAARLYRAGATDAVPETIEASLQLAEAVLVDVGVAMGPVIADPREARGTAGRYQGHGAAARGHQATRATTPARCRKTRRVTRGQSAVRTRMLLYRPGHNSEPSAAAGRARSARNHPRGSGIANLGQHLRVVRPVRAGTWNE